LGIICTDIYNIKLISISMRVMVPRICQKTKVEQLIVWS
jgi:hypothetical protein